MKKIMHARVGPRDPGSFLTADDEPGNVNVPDIARYGFGIGRVGRGGRNYGAVEGRDLRLEGGNLRCIQDRGIHDSRCFLDFFQPARKILDEYVGLPLWSK